MHVIETGAESEANYPQRKVEYTSVSKLKDGVKINSLFRDLIPPLSKEEFEKLEKNILANGCEDPIRTWQGYIVDGHHRYEICTKWLIEYYVLEKDFDNEDQAKLYIHNLQLGRRNITDAAKIRSALAIEEIEKQEAERRMKSGKSDPEVDLPQGKRAPQVRDIIAKKVGVSGSTVERFKRIQEKASKEVVKALCNGTPIHGKKLSIDKVYKDIKTAEKKKHLEEKYSQEEAVSSDTYQVIHSSVAELKTHIKPNSLDAIITDPPYPKEFIHLFEELGSFAHYALKEGAPCIVMCGQAYIKSYLELLGKNLEYHWVVSYAMTKGTQIIWDKRVVNKWKPILVYSKGKLDWSTYNDVVESDIPSKDHHKWEQSMTGFNNLVKAFSLEGGLVCDPFCGSGITGLACLEQGRRFIGADIDLDCVNTTKARLNGAN